jgi:uncharacterized SAM-binding protein YcdF (DUF218 family)
MKKFLVVLSIIIVSSVFFSVFLFVSLLRYINNQAQQDTKIKSDVILVLGGNAYGGTSCYGPICQQKGFVLQRRLNPCLVARVDHAVSLYKDHYAPKILMSGGNDKEDNANEAETMKKIAIEAGVPETDILMEKKSTSTYENFAFSQKILTDAGLHSVIIVTDPYHNARAGLVASKLQYKYSLSADVESPCWAQDKNNFTNRDSVREVWALIGYKLLNKI